MPYPRPRAAATMHRRPASRLWPASVSIRHACLAGMLLVVAAVATACAGSGAPASSGPVATPTALASATPAHITFMVSEDPEGLRAYRDLISAFRRTRPDIDVELTNVPDSGEFIKRLAADFAAGTAPDVFLINYRRLSQFALRDALAPLDQRLAASQVLRPDDFYPAALDAFHIAGHQYCLPQNLSSLQVYINLDLFKAAGLTPPQQGWTWEQFLAAARALTRDTNGDGKTDQYGVGVAPQLLRLAPFVWSARGDIVDDPHRPTRLTLDQGPALAAFRRFVALQTVEHVAPSRADEATENAQTRFASGKLGMFLQSRAVTPDLRATIKDFAWDVAPLPGDVSSATVLHSDGMCLTSRSAHPDAAWAFIEYAVSPDGQRLLAPTGRTVPSLRAVAESPAFLDATPPASNKVYLDAAPQVRSLPAMTTWPQVEDIVNREIQRAFYGDATVEEAARAASEATRDLFDQSLRDMDAGSAR